ncbi:hypothetical protein ACFWAY_26415 [Rhodococcus sp. NPDC059968]|uniref:hypothetical protein n=1 Tax=Rhodococcus sp. NPDC059968 TaxID=3347017 RepID=UPI0036720F19
MVELRGDSAEERRVGIHFTEAGNEHRHSAVGIPAELARSTGMDVEELSPCGRP